MSEREQMHFYSAIANEPKKNWEIYKFQTILLVYFAYAIVKRIILLLHIE